MIHKEKLGSLCHINSGGTPWRGVAEYYGGKIPWAKIGDIEKSNGIIHSTEESITEAGLESIGNRIFPKDTLLFAMYGSVGKVAFSGIELSTNQAILGIRLKQEAKEKLDLEYLKYWFQVNLLFFKSRAVGGILKNLSATIVKDFDIPLPSITDQKRIAKVLSQCETLIQKRKQSIDLLDEFLKSKFNEMFYNEVFPFKTIEEVSLNIIDCPHSTPKYLDLVSDYPCIRTSEIKNGQIDWSSMKYTDYNGYLQRVERLVPQEGDIIFAREGSVGDAAIIPQNVTLSLGQRVMMFRINPDIAIPEYIWAFIRSTKTQHIIKSRSIGATVRRINISEVRKIQCPIPPLETQNQFAEIVQKIKTLKTHLSLSLKELENLYGSISQRAFNGELDLSKIDISDMEDYSKKDAETMNEDTSEENIESLNKKTELLGIVDEKKVDNTYLSENSQLYIDKSKDLRTSVYLLSKTGEINIAEFRDELMALNKIGEELIAEVREYTAWQIDQHKPIERYISLLPENILVEYPNINIFSRNQFDYSSMTLDDYYGIPDDIIEQYGSIEDRTVDMEFFFKKYFSDHSFTLQDVELIYNKVVYDRGDWLKYEEMKDFIFKSMEGENAFFTQAFEEMEISDNESANPKTIKRVTLKVIS